MPSCASTRSRPPRRAPGSRRRSSTCRWAGRCCRMLVRRSLPRSQPPRTSHRGDGTARTRWRSHRGQRQSTTRRQHATDLPQTPDGPQVLEHLGAKTPCRTRRRRRQRALRSASTSVDRPRRRGRGAQPRRRESTPNSSLSGHAAATRGARRRCRSRYPPRDAPADVRRSRRPDGRSRAPGRRDARGPRSARESWRRRDRGRSSARQRSRRPTMWPPSYSTAYRLRSRCGRRSSG